MRLGKKDKGKFVFISLWDHADGDEAAYIETVGWIEAVKKEALILRHWRSPRDADFNDEDGDIAIVRSAIIEIRELPQP